MQATDGLVLRDIHASTAPAWWPPAPGWWLVAALLVAVVGGIAAWRVLRARRLQRIARLFDNTVAAADTPVDEVAAISSLLRRAARRRDPRADRLQGDAWLDFLDAGAGAPRFRGEVGALLRDGGFRPSADPGAVAALRVAARARFVDWMGGRR